MECNKEEAFRAKDMAENKMRLKEFSVARKIVMKAQRLFPDLENAGQMLTVCEVHCSAEAKVNGETDWYAILQIESTADENTIKKQYRKLALLLHPDKNKFEGAEAAFKLVGEAQRTLSDKTKRNLHDIKRRTVIRNVQVKRPSQQANRPPVARKPAVVPNVATSSTQPNGLNQQHPPQPSNAQTFWTICPFCGIRYQYYLSIVNKALRCQHCMKPFVAYDLNAQAVPSGANTNSQWSHAGIPQHGNRNPHAQPAGQNSQFGNTGFQGNAGVGSTSSKPVPKSAEAGAATADDKAKYEKVIPDGVNKKEQVVKPSGGSTRQKKARKLVVESESSADSGSSDSDVIIEDNARSEAHNAGTADSNVRRSTRVKQNVSYKENGDATESSPRSFKRLRKSEKMQSGGDASKTSFEGKRSVGEQSSGQEKHKFSQNGLHEKQNGTDGIEENLHKAPFLNSSPDAEDISNLTYPDPEFFDFEKGREASLFEPNQMWAIYDDLDGMPRFYARIKNASRPDFKVMYTWLEYDPTGVAETEWADESLPVSCGKFKLGKTMTTREKAIFSHLISCKPGMKKNSFVVHPRKGEVWALFKGWNSGWSSDADNHKSFEYEVVEVLSEFTEGTGVTVANLVKINGFVCLFMRASDGGPREIPSSEMLRFSHQVPSYRMTGAERENIPPGSFELDATSLPINFAECFPSVTIGTSGTTSSKVNQNVHEKQRTRECSPNRPNVTDKMDTDTVTGTSGTASSRVNDNVHEKQRTRESSPNKPNVTDKMETDKETVAPEQKLNDQETSQADSVEDDENVSSPAAPVDFAYPDTEFYSFADGKSKGNFESGQIWALYSDITSYPNYYGLVTKVESVGKFAVHLRWLDGCAVKKEEKRWAKDMSFSCGTFEVGKETMTYDSVDPFSHVVKAEPLDRRDLYSIHPKIGEVWAVYKNWNIRWTRSTVEDCEYDVVEILGRNAFGIKCEYLTKVAGHRCVFRPERNAMIDIPATEYLRFSHHIPAFRLTEEMGGKLRGYWELDPASIPQLLLVDD